MFCLNGIENFVEIWSAEMCLCLQTGEDTATGHSLEVFFADVLNNNNNNNDDDAPNHVDGKHLQK